jgi:hypothetical protein
MFAPPRVVFGAVPIEAQEVARFDAVLAAYVLEQPVLDHVLPAANEALAAFGVSQVDRTADSMLTRTNSQLIHGSASASTIGQWSPIASRSNAQLSKDLRTILLQAKGSMRKLAMVMSVSGWFVASLFWYGDHKNATRHGT